MTIPGGGSAGLAYRALADTKIVGAALHATVEPATGEIACRTELMNLDPNSNLDTVVASGWGTYAQDTGRIRVATFSSVPDGLHAGADFAAIRASNQSGAPFVPTAGTPAQCSLKNFDPAAVGNDAQGDLFTVYMKDQAAPTIVAPLAPASNENNQLEPVPWIIRDGDDFSIKDGQGVDFTEQRWYRPGQLVRHVIEATDKGSGIDQVQISTLNSPFPTGAVTLGADRTIRVCALNTGTFDSPCPLAPPAMTKEEVLGSNLRQGPNSVWYRATDFVENRAQTTALTFMMDSLAPVAPAVSFGTTIEPGSSEAIGELPTYDTDGPLIVTWAGSTDPGADVTPIPTGSGIEEYTVRVLRRNDAGQYVPNTANYETTTNPVAGSVMPPQNLDIAGREGIYKIELLATDRAGNTSEPSVRYFRIDDTDPFVVLAKPAGEDSVEVRSSNLPSDSIRASIVDPSIGGGNILQDAVAKANEAGNLDVLDSVALQRRTTDGWSDITTKAPQRWTPATPYTVDSLPSGVGDGRHELRIVARDGARSDGTFRHQGESSRFDLCVDRDLHGQIAYQPTKVEAVAITYAGSKFNGARVIFTVPGIATTGVVYKWIIEARVGTQWVTVASPLQTGLTTEYRVDDWSARTPGTEYRVSAATQKCTRGGDQTIATEGSLTGNPIPVNQPERMMPLLGLEQRWSFWSMPLGGGTDAHVNTATGNVVVTRPLLQEPGTGLWTNVSLSYNSQQLGDDELLATNGIAGAHMTMAFGPGGGAGDAETAAAGLRFSNDTIVMRDADGTIRVFEPIGTATSTAWNGRYQATDGARLSLRNILAPGAAPDDTRDGIAGAVFKLTRPDGLTYYFAADRTVNNATQADMGRLLAVRDREGHTLTYHYECVAVMPNDAGVVRAYRVHRAADATWNQVPETAGAQIVPNCPSNVLGVHGANDAADLRMRLVAVRDSRYAQDSGREIRISYHAPDADAAGHIYRIRGHLTNGQARTINLGYDIAGKTVRLTTISSIGRGGDTRTVTLGYDATMNDPGKWFDKNVILGTVTDHKNQPTRFSYTVPDADAGLLFVNPRAHRIENRMDVLRGDRRGVTLNYYLASGDIGNGAQALRLGGQTTLRDQLDRATKYNWDASEPTKATYGRPKSTVEPGGLTTALTWNDNHEVTATIRSVAHVIDEPVHIPALGSTRVLTGPIDPNSSVTIRSQSGDNLTGRYTVDDRGVISPNAAAPRDTTILVTYEPAASRRVLENTPREPFSGLPDHVQSDKRWTIALGNRERSQYTNAGSGRPVTQLTWTASQGPTPARAIVRDLTRIVGPRGGASYTDLNVDPATGRVTRIDAPGGSGTRSIETRSYYPSGLLRATTDALGWTVAYTNYTDDGEPQLVSRRFCTGGACGAPLPGWTNTLPEDNVADIIPQAFRINYDADAAVTCIRDVRGTTTQDDARFVGFIYDEFGNVVVETSPWRRDPDTGQRIRRATSHDYDKNGNLESSERDRVYRLGDTFAAGDCTQLDGLSAGTRTSSDRSLNDTQYDALDRVILTHVTSNNIDGANRRARTEYDLVGNVTLRTEPNHEEGIAGFDYTLTTAYDERDRPVMLTDGEQRRTCTYYDAFDNPVATTPARWQGRTACPAAPDLTRSTFATFDNAGDAVSTRAINGKVSFTLTDDEGNPVRSEDLGGERVGRAARLQTDLRVTTRTFDAAGNVLTEQLPPRNACIAAGITGCSSTSAHTPKTSTEYDALSRAIATRTVRQNGETGLGSTSATRYAYDADGRRVREILAGGSEADRIARTEYDPFGNVIATTLPNSGPTTAQDRFETAFAYGDDDALITKNDRPHDVLTTWGYDRRGLMVSRTDQGSGPEQDQWDSTHRFTYWDDGSLRSGPVSIAQFAANRVYADGTCLRQPGSSPTRPTYVYLVLGDQQISPAGGAPNWNADDWREGQVRRTGRIRLRKLAYGDGIIRTYDHNGQLAAVRGCGTSIEWTRRDGTGAPLRILNQDGGETRYRYGTGGELVEEEYPDGRSRTARYITPDDDPFTIDPGAGLEEIVALDRPNLRRRYLQASYDYTLDGAIDIQGRSNAGTYRIAANDTIAALTPKTFTTYEYDHIGALVQSRTTEAAHAITGPPMPATKPVKAGKAKPATPPKKGVQAARELVQEDVIRDLAGNPRRVTTTVLRAGIKKGSATRTQTRLFTYDVLDRLSTDDISALPARNYIYDGYGRLDRVTTQGQNLENSTYADATRGSMLLRSKLVGLNPATRQLTTLDYGNGRDSNLADTIAGPRGQLARSTTYDGATTSTGLDEVITYGFTPLNEQAYATERTLEPLRPRQSRTNRARRTTDTTSSYMNYDLLGRRVSTNDHEDDLSDAKRAKRSATLSLYAGADPDPYSESTNNPHQPSARWIVRHQGTLVGELRGHSSRYLVGNHQGTTLTTLAGNGAVVATFDNDTWGEPSNGPLSLTSGTSAEQRHNIYGYTGMRESNAGNTTNHHARDYRSDLKTWIQNDQYMDPMADLGLSLDPTTRDRHAYALGNPVGNTDTNGHRTLIGDCNSGCKIRDPRKEGTAAGSGAVEVKDKCQCPWAYSPETNPGDPDHNTGETRPTVTLRESATPITWDPPAMPLDQRISFELDSRWGDDIDRGIDETQRRTKGTRFAGWCVTGGYARDIPIVASGGGELTGCVTRINGDWAAPITIAAGPGGGSGWSATTGPFFTNATRSSQLRGVDLGVGASSQVPFTPVALNLDADTSVGSSVSAVVISGGLGTGIEAHQRNTWTPWVIGAGR